MDPQVRADLEIHEVELDGRSVHLLVDPVVRQKYAIEADGAKLIALLKQSGGVSAVKSKLTAELGGEFDPNEIDQFVARLGRMGLLVDGADSQRRRVFARGELERQRLNELRQLVAYAMDKVPYYRKRYGALGIKPEKLNSLEDFARLPFLTREDVRQNFPEGFLPDGLDAAAATASGEIRFTMSSGTTGARLQFASSERRRSAQEISGQLINWLFFDPKSIYRAAVFTTLRCSGMVCARDMPQMEARIAGNHVTLLPAEDPAAPTLAEAQKMLKELEAHGAQWLVADPAYLVLLSHLIADQKLAVPKLRGILSGYEFLSDLHRGFIERLWGCPMFDQYTSTELGKVMMLECEHKTLHVNDAHLYSELIRDGVAVGPGQTGRVVQTTLKETIPLIRYDTGDLAVAADRSYGCACGGVNSVVACVAGRGRDVFAAVDGRLCTTRDLDRVLAPLGGIRFYQLVQETPDRYAISVIPAPEADSASLTAAVAQAVRGLIGATGQVDVKIKRRIYPEMSGKFQLTRSDVIPAPEFLLEASP